MSPPRQLLHFSRGLDFPVKPLDTLDGRWPHRGEFDQEQRIVPQQVSLCLSYLYERMTLVSEAAKVRATRQYPMTTASMPDIRRFRMMGLEFAHTPGWIPWLAHDKDFNNETCKFRFYFAVPLVPEVNLF